MTPPDDAPIASLRNLGPKTGTWLIEAGVETVGDLRRLGAVEVFRRLKMMRSRQVSLNALWAMQAGLMDLPWTALPPAIKEQLRQQLAS